MKKIDAHKIAQDFTILDQSVNDEPLVYLDNAATTQKPQKVLDALNDYYHTINANVHRGVHTLADLIGLRTLRKKYFKKMMKCSSQF